MMAFPTEATDVISNVALADEIPLGEKHVGAMRGGVREMAAEFRRARFAGDNGSGGPCHLRERALDIPVKMFRMLR